jgi:hypothetical protein
VCVCVGGGVVCTYVYVCVCVCARVREREREIGLQISQECRSTPETAQVTEPNYARSIQSSYESE